MQHLSSIVWAKCFLMMVPPYILTDHALTPVRWASHLLLLFLLLSLHQYPSLLPLSFFLSDFLQRLSVFEHHIVLSSRPSAQKKKREAQVSLHGFEISSLNIPFYSCFPDGSAGAAGHRLQQSRQKTFLHAWKMTPKSLVILHFDSLVWNEHVFLFVQCLCLTLKSNSSFLDPKSFCISTGSGINQSRNTLSTNLILYICHVIKHYFCCWLPLMLSSSKVFRAVKKSYWFAVC